MFDWKTDDEWADDDTAVSTKPASPPETNRRSKYILVGLLLGLGVLLGVGLVWRLLNREVTAVTNSVESQLADVHWLLLQTAVADDEELFQALVSEENRTWQEAQIHLLRRDLWLNRAPMGLWLAEPLATQNQFETAVTLNADLTEAVVTMTLPYLTLLADDSVQEIQLRQTAVYQKEDEAWLLAEPDTDFWGQYTQVERPYITIATPERDVALAERLADDLNELVAQICRPELAACDADFVFGLRLAREPLSLLALSSQNNSISSVVNLQRSEKLNVPTPTLLGLPVDESAYKAVLRSYAAQVAQEMLQPQNIRKPNRPTRPMNVEATLKELGLFSPWPLGYHPTRVQEPPPIPLPKKDVALSCWRPSDSMVRLYDLQTEQSQQLLEVGGGTPGFFGSLMPNGRGVLLPVTKFEDNSTQMIWLNDGRERQLLFEEEFPLIRQVSEIEPGHYHIFYTEGQESIDNIKGVILDEAACSETACPLTATDLKETLSDDGRYRLITRLTAEGELVGELVIEVQVENGTSLLDLSNVYTPPFWLDDHTLAFVQPEFDEQTNEQTLSLMIVTAVDAAAADGQIQPEVRVNTEDLSRLGAAAGMSVIRSFTLAANSEPSTEKLALLAYDEAGNFDQVDAVFTYDWQNDELALEAQIPPGSPRVFASASPNGRYLHFIDAISGPNLYVYDQQENEWQTFSIDSNRVIWGNFLWSADDAWLLLLDNDLLRLIAPSHHYEKTIFNSDTSCSNPAWIDWE